MPDDPDFKGMTPDNTFVEVTLHFTNDEYTMVIIDNQYCFVELKDMFFAETGRIYLRKCKYDEFISK